MAVLAVCAILAATQLRARQATPPYLNPALPADQRAADLVSRMSLDGKVSQLVNDAPAKVSVAVRNIGERVGDEVVQLWGAGGVAVAADADRAAAQVHPP